VWACTSFSPYAFLKSTGRVYLYAIRRLDLALKLPFLLGDVLLCLKFLGRILFRTHFLWGGRENLIIDNGVSLISSSHV